MDDFLHNLRSGKLKQADRQNRSYGDQHKGGQRRNMPDRRKRDGENKEVCERLQAIKEILENLAATQKRLADAFIERNRTEARRNKAMEMMTESIYRLLFPDAENAGRLLAAASSAADPSQEASPPATEAPQAAAFVKPTDDASPTPSGEKMEEVPVAASQPSAEAVKDTGEDKVDKQEERQTADGGLSETDRDRLFAVIHQMRAEGNNWERIARHIAAQGYPTLSGKGIWRGVTVKNLYNKMAAPA
ncbi:hypothetical protein [Desulfatitalea alkaliphila]|uniref:Recombinase n=1 Tax=Desulfatitalea alkaliphila TaxID=2929485 RepID=A0AA41UQW1_9BACT|nr:hypothetical protein [Desulfatitalea alkaliphila]MCJ8501763.1 hypothetical protein [Desulfatitalea alkaliphila]